MYIIKRFVKINKTIEFDPKLDISQILFKSDEYLHIENFKLSQAYQRFIISEKIKNKNIIKNNMEELKKYQLISEAETFEELYTALDAIGPIKGSGDTMYEPKYLKNVIESTRMKNIDFSKFYGPTDAYGYGEFNWVTRTYGLRAKVIYLKLYDRNIN